MNTKKNHSEKTTVSRTFFLLLLREKQKKSINFFQKINTQLTKNKTLENFSKLTTTKKYFI